MRLLALALVLGVLSFGAVRFGPALVPSAPPPSPDTVAQAPVQAEAGGGVEASRVVARVQTVTYPVLGATAGELLASLRASAPQSEEGAFFGLTTSEMAYRYLRQPTAEGCRIEQVRVTLDVTITLPTWDESGDADYEVRRDWHRFLSALRRHEDGHRAIAEAGAHDLLDAIDGLQAPTCEAADAEAQRAADRSRVESEAAQRHLDDQTDHGRTEGAVWPL